MMWLMEGDTEEEPYVASTGQRRCHGELVKLRSYR